MGRETAKYRDETFRRLQRACQGLGVRCEEDGAARVVYLPGGRRWRLTGGGGVGVMRCQVLLADGTTEAEVTATLGRLLGSLTRAAERSKDG